MPLLIIKDTTAGGKTLNQIPVTFTSELVTVKEIIEARVNAEVEAYNAKLPEYFQGLVQPEDAEKTLKGYKLIERKKVDAEKQRLIALNAFTKNGFFILIDNIQGESLEQMVVITEKTDINFVKLTPLVGG